MTRIVALFALAVACQGQDFSVFNGNIRLHKHDITYTSLYIIICFSIYTVVYHQIKAGWSVVVQFYALALQFLLSPSLLVLLGIGYLPYTIA